MAKRTRLYDVYSKYDGVKIVDFHGWEMPLQFKKGIIYEHNAVRNKAGLFDVSHMGEFLLQGEKAEEFLDWLVTNNVKDMNDYSCIYSPMCNPKGGVIDDLLIYKYNNQKYMLVVNGSNIKKDFNWISCENDFIKNNQGLKILNNSDSISMIAVQGPKAQSILQKIIDFDLSTLSSFCFKNKVSLNGTNLLISRTGYTGEDGFELYIDSNNVSKVWEQIINSEDIEPCGLGARDTLRLEAKLMLYGNDLNDTISPLESGLKYFVDMNKTDFCGKSVLEDQIKTGIRRIIRGIEMVDKGVPRHGYKVLFNGNEIGEVTSGGKSPTLNKFIALVLIKRGIVKTGSQIDVLINNKLKKAKIIKTPFYRRGQ